MLVGEVARFGSKMGGDGEYILACQRDSHMKSLTGVRVLECMPWTQELAAVLVPQSELKRKGKKKGGKENGKGVGSSYAVRLSDSVLFPEGGGQPFDLGWIGFGDERVHVSAVYRSPDDGKTWHVTFQHIPCDSVVDVHLDWERRLDYMQCHSGQHLISSVALNRLGLETVGWSLTPKGEACYVDLQGTKLLQDNDLVELESLVNAEIRKSRVMTPKVYSPEEFSKLNDIRLKALPDAKFPVRVVEIDGLDISTCCGTHVKALGELQVAHLLGNQVLGNKSHGNVTVNRVSFVLGERAIAMFSSLHQISKSLTTRLSCAPSEFADRCDSQKATIKSNLKAIKNMHKQLIGLLGDHLAKDEDKKLIIHHQSDGNMAFAKQLCETIQAKSTAARAVLVSFGDEDAGSGGGYYLLGSQELHAATLEHFSSKGGGKAPTFQGKIPPQGLTASKLENAYSVLSLACAQSSS